ncbi:RNA-dependent RNA polymerase 2 [Medicago truncatula]|uniref:RNA-dependent RNA polymerase 2 n=1 Tax=Medicago truncatula TaxID=3880 RepID=UPI0019687096|nr:RNA-dependent RNA polymerase 2-like [Medicago truncatula]
MIKDTLGAISTAHLVHADCESNKAKSRKCLELAELHSMAVDFAKTGALAEMPRVLKPKEFPDFMERFEKPMELFVEEAYDHQLEANGFKAFLETASTHKEMYAETIWRYEGSNYDL